MSYGKILRMNTWKNETRWIVNGKILPQLEVSETGPELGKETSTENNARLKEKGTKGS